MKKAMNILLSAMMMAGLFGCAGNSAANEQPAAENTAEKTEEEKKEDVVTQEEDAIDDPAWDALNSLGEVKTENGLLYVYITMPAELAGEEVTQEKLDEGAGTTYTSATLNEDGSVTYKMTKKQHKAMLDAMNASIDEALNEIVSSDDYAISEITHNADYTSFDIKLTTEELGITEGFMVLAFYMYGGMYSILAGKSSDITVNYFSSNGDLIYSANSAEANN